MLKNTHTHINNVLFPTNLQMSVNFCETYIPVNESKQTHTWSKKNVISSAVAVNVCMLYNFCPLSDVMNLSYMFSLSRRYSYWMIHNVTSWYSRLYCLTSQALIVYRNKLWTRNLTVAGSKPVLGKWFGTSKYLPKTFARRRLRTEDLTVNCVSDWLIDL